MDTRYRSQTYRRRSVNTAIKWQFARGFLTFYSYHFCIYVQYTNFTGNKMTKTSQQYQLCMCSQILMKFCIFDPLHGKSSDLSWEMVSMHQHKCISYSRINVRTILLDEWMMNTVTNIFKVLDLLLFKFFPFF